MSHSRTGEAPSQNDVVAGLQTMPLRSTEGLDDGLETGGRIPARSETCAEHFFLGIF